jgi:hypothetical protein
MANTLANFLVGIGLDFDTKGAKQAASSMDSIKRSALQAGAAVAGAFGTKALTSDLANQTRGYTMLAEQIGTTANNVFALDRAYQRAGGGAGDVIGQLERLKQLQAGLQVGDVGFIESAARAGIDTRSIIGESDPTKVFEDIIGQLESMSTNQRLNAINALGLDPVAINLASKGVKDLQRQIDKALNRRSISDQLSKDSEQFATQWFDMWDEIGGITDRAGSKILPAVNEITGSVNAFFETNREGVNSGVDLVFGKIAENLDSVAVAAVALGASGIGSTIGMMAKHLPIIGGTAGMIGALAKSLGAVGIAYAAADIASGLIDDQGQKFDWYRDAESALNESLHAITGLDRFGTDEYWANKNSAMTVITPQDTAQLSAPVQQAQSFQNIIQAQHAASRGFSNQQPQPIVNNIYLEGRMIKQTVNNAMDERDEQAVKDLRSPIER